MEPYDKKKNDPQTQKQREEYKQHVASVAPKSKLFTGCIKAFLVGGLICCIGQGINIFASEILKTDKQMSASITSITMVFLGSLLTGLGVYDNIGKFAGGGSIVPITGFANSIVSPAMEHKREGYILGIGANMFKIAGPVLVNGISASVIYGIILLIIGK